MSLTVAQLLNAVLALPDEKRVEVAEAVMASLRPLASRRLGADKGGG
jgi:hypothetical protein